MVVVPALLPDTTSKAGFAELDPISQWFRGGSGTSGATATGIADDDRYGLDLTNSGIGGFSFRATSGNGAFGLRVNNTAAASLGNFTVGTSLVVANGLAVQTGVSSFGGSATVANGFVVVTGTSLFNGPTTAANGFVVVTGVSSFGGSATSVGTFTALSNINVGSAVSVGTTLGVGTTSDFTGAATFRSSIVVSGASLLTGNVTMSNSVLVNGGIAVGGDASMASTLVVTGRSTFNSSATFTAQIVSTVGTGTAPFTVTSGTLVSNLNAQMLNGISSGSFARVDAATDFTTAPTIQGDVIAKIKVGSYSGNNGTTAVTGVGFSPKIVFIDEPTGPSSGFFNQANQIVVTPAGGTSAGGGVQLDADGFTILSATGNVSGRTYTYVAIG